MSLSLCRCLYDPFPNPAGAGGSPAAAPGVRHRSASEERQHGRVEVHQSIPDRNRWVDLPENKNGSSKSVIQHPNIII